MEVLGVKGTLHFLGFVTPDPEPLTRCDKCGERVEPGNDAVLLAIATGELDGLSAVFAQSRHLLPEGNCEGSPSRAQYLEGQPRDTRAEYPYDKRLEKPVREAYAAVQHAVRVYKAELN